MATYRSKEWKEYRAKVIEYDDYRCVKCGRSTADGVTLHVHHKHYQSGKKPWEYPFESCETLCGGCHAAEHGLVPPRSGWQYAGWDDLGDLSGSCDLCGKELRYSFLVTHPDWTPLEVGEQCCDTLTSTDDATIERESIRRREGKRNRFVKSPRWRWHPFGVQAIKHLRIDILIGKDAGGFFISIGGTEGKKRYATLDETKGAAFDFVESGKAHTFLSRRRANRQA